MGEIRDSTKKETSGKGGYFILNHHSHVYIYICLQSDIIYMLQKIVPMKAIVGAFAMGGTWFFIFFV